MNTNNAARQGSVEGNSSDTMIDGGESITNEKVEILLRFCAQYGGSVALAFGCGKRVLLYRQDFNADFWDGGLYPESVKLCFDKLIADGISVLSSSANASQKYDDPNRLLNDPTVAYTAFRHASTQKAPFFTNYVAMSTQNMMPVLEIDRAVNNLAAITDLVTDFQMCDSSAGFHSEIPTLYAGIPCLSSDWTGSAMDQRRIRMEGMTRGYNGMKKLDDDQTCGMMDEEQVNVVQLPSVRLGVLPTDVCLGTYLTVDLYTFGQLVEAGPGGEGEPTKGGD